MTNAPRHTGASATAVDATAAGTGLACGGAVSVSGASETFRV